MSETSDLFGYTPAQGNLFGVGENRMQAPTRSTIPDPDKIRVRLLGLLDKARAAETMPWPEREARMWRTVFPNMANWLPEAEAARLRLEFSAEFERLRQLA